MQSSRDTHPSRGIAGWTVLAIGAVRLALPQRDVRQIELAADLKDSAAGEGREIGWFIRKNGASWPAYSFAESLRLERPASPGRKLCVFVGEQTANGPIITTGRTSEGGKTAPAFSALPPSMAGASRASDSARGPRTRVPGVPPITPPIGEDDAVRGILCNRVWSFAADADLGIEAVPGCMTGVCSPATGLAQFEGTAALVTDRAALTAYLDFLLEPGHGEHG